MKYYNFQRQKNKLAFLFAVTFLLFTIAIASKTKQVEYETLPHLGGDASEAAVLLVVKFAYVPKGLVFKQMVQTIQEALASGGILTNAFRPKQVIGRDKERALEAAMYVDGIEQAVAAKQYLDALPEVSKVYIQQNSQVNAPNPKVEL